MIWQDGAGGPPQPFALFLETTESHWRTRGVPKLLRQPAGDPNGVQRYQMVEQAWLDLVETSAGPARVSRFIHTTDGARTFAFLQPGSRGSTLKVSLRRSRHPLFEAFESDAAPEDFASIDLTKAPWEDAA
jgi:hypothetical protein